MKLDNQVVSLDLAKWLKELGVNQELEECSPYYDRQNRLWGWTSGEDKLYNDYVKAPSVAELERCCRRVMGQSKQGLLITKSIGRYNLRNDQQDYYGGSEANARAKIADLFWRINLFSFPPERKMPVKIFPCALITP